MTLTRQPILHALQAALEPLSHVHAMWQGGAAAFGRVDEWSDIDVQFASRDDRVDDVFRTIEATLESLSPIELRHVLPTPTWHGHAQAVYLLRDTSPFLLLDVVVMKESSGNRFLEPETHGQVVVHFDKTGFVEAPSFDESLLAEKLRGRLESLRLHFDLFQCLVLKEVHRGNDIEAQMYYSSFTLRPLIELLRIQHKPGRHGFHARYIHYDLPPEVVDRLMPLVFVRDAADILEKRESAQRLFDETFSAISLDDLSDRI